jgi:cytochrome c1
MRLLWTSLAVAVAGVAAVAGIVADDRYEQSDTRVRAEAITGGSAAHGREAFIEKGCGGCHTVGGVAQATGLVGPPLDGFAERAIIAGKLENTPPNLVRWISAPQSVDPGNAMPNLPMTDRDARDIAAFLYTRS